MWTLINLACLSFPVTTRNLHTASVVSLHVAITPLWTATFVPLPTSIL